MSAARPRGRSFHNDTDETEPDLVVEDKQQLESYDPTYDPSFDTSEENQEEESGPSDEEFSRGRSRSRSMHENDESKIKTFTETEIIAQQQQHQQQQQLAKEKAHESSKTEHAERSGPLRHTEVLALQKGLQEATTKKKDKDTQEEKAELEAALREKEQRQLSIAPAIGADPPMKRVKILVLGDSGVGKTSIICRLTNNEFNSKLVSTIGIDFKVVKVMVDGNPVQAQIWDTAGSEKFHKITTSYYRGCNGIILVYDISSRKTLENIDYWVSNIKAHATDSVYVAIVGNKMDLRDDPNMADKCVSESEGHAIAEKYHIPYSETSALTSHNLQESFHYIVESVVFADMPPGSHHHSSHSQGGLLGQWRMHTKKSLSTDKKSPSSPQFNTSRALSSSSSGSTTTSNEEGASVHKDKDKCIVS